MEIGSTWSRTRKTRHENCELGFFLDYRLQTRPTVSGLKIPWDIVNSVSRFAIRKHLKSIKEIKNPMDRNSIDYWIDRNLSHISYQNNVRLKTREIMLENRSQNIEHIDQILHAKLRNYIGKRVKSFFQITEIANLSSHSNFYLVDEFNSVDVQGFELMSNPDLIMENGYRFRLIKFVVQKSTISDQIFLRDLILLWALKNEFLPNRAEKFEVAIYTWDGSGWDVAQFFGDTFDSASMISGLQKDISRFKQTMSKGIKEGKNSLRASTSLQYCKSCKHYDFCGRNDVIEMRPNLS